MEGTIESLCGCQSLRAYLVEDENAPKDMLIQCIQNLFSECAHAEGGDHQDAAGQRATTAVTHTSGAARSNRPDNSPDHQGRPYAAAGSTTTNKRARVTVKQEQM